MVQSLTPPGIIVPSGVSDSPMCLEVSNEENRVGGVQTIITEYMDPHTIDPVSVQI